jgi:peroxiredoxin
MASALNAVTHAAHHLTTSLISEVKPGAKIPAIPVKEESAETATALTLRGKNIIVGVPGPFTETCTKGVRGYLDNVKEFKKHGIENIYVVAVNDLFVVKAWKEKLAPKGTPIHFVADDQGRFVSALGLLFDATPLLGAPRSKRFVIVTQDDKAEIIAVEENPSEITSTDATRILALLAT